MQDVADKASGAQMMSSNLISTKLYWTFLPFLFSLFLYNSDGLQPAGDGLQPTSDGLQPSSFSHFAYLAMPI